jgi:N-methylhydantoinase B
VNIALPTTIACCYVAIKHIFPALPANAGVMRPITINVPEGSLLSAEFPAPTGGYTETILRMIDVIFSAAAKAVPERIVANAYGTINALSIADRARQWPALGDVFFLRRRSWRVDRERWAEPRQRADFYRDDPSDAEILEAAYPVMFRQWALRPDSAGHGMHRGGLGAVYEIELLEEQAEAFLFGERGRFAAAGRGGWQEAAKNSLLTKPTRAGLSLPLASKMVGIPEARTAVRLETPGGGGYGRPRGARAVGCRPRCRAGISERGLRR